jgi:bacterioferritin-associated ferredoxin
MIVCHCAGVSDATIARLVESGVSTLAEITRRTGAGRCCEPCRDEIRGLLHSPAGGTHTSSSTEMSGAAAAA